MIGELREIFDTEIELMRSWRNDPAVRNNMYTTHEISVDEHRQWWGRTKERADCQYFMYDFGGMPTGIVGFTQIDPANRSAFWAFYANPLAARGAGSRMEYLALEHAFGSIGLRKLSCEVLAFNAAVIRLHNKFGFREEGVFREHHLMQGDFVDVHRLALFSVDWATRRDAMFNKLNSAIKEH